ncbi:dynamin family protein [Mailhella massiliensis]|uniref:dynamin family protein n=1 Tax=Mailhella massiliensis TaxID=1903261 RepID=UPI0023561108|nr:dynamin family protein [Mailhella massiliensis]
MQNVQQNNTQFVQRYIKGMEQVLQELKPCYEANFLHANAWFRLNDIARSLRAACSEQDERFRLMRVAIVGAVKAGKSTFLNALLFGGKAVLPSAATPMTASLTRLFYSEKPTLTLQFYSREDWNDICAKAGEARRNVEEAVEKRRREWQAQRQNQPSAVPFPEDAVRRSVMASLPEELKACLELTEEAEKRHIDVDALLDTREEYSVNSLEEVAEKLRETVCRDGRYSAVVRYVELGLREELLKDLEIIDTPGLNDPVVSRSRQTSCFLSQCDAVVLLSYAGQFLTEQDQELFSRRLREEGISRVVLVACKMDQAMLDHSGSGRTFEEAFRETLRSVRKAAGKHTQLSPIPISAYLASVAFKKEAGRALSEEERHVMKQLAGFPKAPAAEDTASLRGFANLKAVHKEFEQCRLDKDAIKAARQRELISGKSSAFRECLKDLDHAACQARETLEQGDLDKLQKSVSVLKKNMEGVRNSVDRAFLDCERKIKEYANDLILSVNDYIDNFYTSINVYQSTHNEERTRSSGWFIFKNTETFTVEVTENFVNIADVCQIFRDFMVQIAKKINNVYANDFPLDALMETVTNIVKDAFNGCHIDFSEDVILQPLRRAFNGIGVPVVVLDDQPSKERIITEFGDGKVLNNDIHRLKTFVIKEMHGICDSSKERINVDVAEIIHVMRESCDSFVENIVDSFQKEVESIAEKVRDRENNIRKYDATISLIRECVSQMTQSERPYVG